MGRLEACLCRYAVNECFGGVVRQRVGLESASLRRVSGWLNRCKVQRISLGLRKEKNAKGAEDGADE